MAKKAYIGVNTEAYGCPYCGGDNVVPASRQYHCNDCGEDILESDVVYGTKSVARKIKKGYIGVRTQQRNLGSMTEGDVVQINENGSPVDFYVAKHNYESGLNGEGRTLLVRKTTYGSRAWHTSSVNAYASSDIDTWLNNTYKSLLDSNVQSAIGTTTFRYTPGNGSVTVGTLSRSAFLLSMTELGVTFSYANVEGSAIPIASKLNASGVRVNEWTRSPSNDTKQKEYVCYMRADVQSDLNVVTGKSGVRPCFTLPATLAVTNGLVTGAEAGLKEVARRIKKAYIGIGGVARPCWSGGELAYYGQLGNGNTKKEDFAGISFGPYALFAGGNQGSATYTTKIDVYDKNLTWSQHAQGLSSSAMNLAAAIAPGYAIFAGGEASSERKTVNAFDMSLVRTSPTSLAEGRQGLKGATAGSYAVFAGGQRGDSEKDTVEAYGTDLVLVTPQVLSTKRYKHAAASVGKYALFAAGIWSSNASQQDTVDAYDENLTRTAAMTMLHTQSELTGVSVGSHALFAGGYTGTGYVANAYDENLTRTNPGGLSVSRKTPAAATVEGFALFAGGSLKTTVDAYDESLTHTVQAELVSPRQRHAGAAVGNYAVFTGGRTTSSTSGITNTTEAFVVA